MQSRFTYFQCSRIILWYLIHLDEYALVLLGLALVFISLSCQARLFMFTLRMELYVYPKKEYLLNKHVLIVIRQGISFKF